MKLQDKYLTTIDPKAIDEIEWSAVGAGESGWFIFLKDGWSFDPMSVDDCIWIPASNPESAMSVITYTIGE